MMFCKHVKRYHTYEVECAKCGETRWPYLPEKPDRYTCQRCVSGAGERLRTAGRIGAAARKALRQPQAGLDGAQG